MPRGAVTNARRSDESATIGLAPAGVLQACAVEALDNIFAEVVGGFAEVVGIVADAPASAARLCRATGFVVRHAGPMDAGGLALTGLATGTSAHEVLIAHPDSVRGAIRLVQPAGPPAPLMRPGGRAWDSGGIFDINLRALRGIEPLHRAFAAAGFAPHAPITDWDFGALAVREVVESDADGLCVALMERVHPPLTGYDGVRGPASWVFNSTQVVADFAAARAFYCDALGWLPVQETSGLAAHDETGSNCMGFAPAEAATIAMRIGIYHPLGLMTGSIEIIAYGVAGADFSAQCRAPQRGWASLRLPVRDLADFAARARAGGCAVSDGVAIDWAPYGPARAIAAVTPWGARLEAVSPG